MKKNNVTYFIDELKKLCVTNNVELRLIEKYSQKVDGVSVGGAFGGVKKMVLISCTKRPDWLHILIHESCHMDQYLYDKNIWINKGDSYDPLDDWLHDKRVHDINKHINNVQDLELDCEKRAVVKIKNFDLPIDIEEYIKKANAYIYFFSYLKHSRRWFGPKNSPYVNEKIWKEMPNQFQKSYRKLPKKYFELFNAS